MKYIYLPTLAAIFLISNLSAQTQVITNDVTISISYAYESNGSLKGNIYTTPPPVVKTFSTSDLIQQLAKCYPSIVSKGAKFQVLVDTNNNVTPQIKNSNSTVVNVSEVIQFNLGTNYLYSGSYNTTTGALTDNGLGTVQMVYDDTSKNLSNGFSIAFQALASTSFILNPTKLSGVFNVNTTFSLTGGIGEGFSLISNGTSALIIKNASLNAKGSGSLNYNN
jgi:hypothetical protein